MEALIILYLAFVVFFLASFWKAFAKSGAPGWAALIPFFNMYVMVKMAGKEGWWFLLMFIPIVNFVVAIIVLIRISENFGKSTAFALGLIFLGFIFWPILGFGSAEWQAEPVRL